MSKVIRQCDPGQMVKLWVDLYNTRVIFNTYKTLISVLLNFWYISQDLRQEDTGPTVGCLKCLGRLGQGWEQICSVCSAVLEAFVAARTLSAPIQHAKYEKPSEPLDSLVGCVPAVWPFWLAVCPANQCGVWEGRNTVWALFFYALCSVIGCFHIAPPAYCISRKHRPYTLLWSWQLTAFPS